ncbi:MAG: hypothetical protein IPP90_20915 [Gemmatimonadaceae bacterium]|nr:hypothetical protein [Gemmatimonadaceae bacterium]
MNQQRHVVEEIVKFGKTHGVAFECGSEPESQSRAGTVGNHRASHCLQRLQGSRVHALALMGQKLGHRVFIVLEQFSELRCAGVAADLDVTPVCGVRIKLASEGAGRWAQSGSEKSKFGLSFGRVDQAHRSAAGGRPSRHPRSSSTSIWAADHRHSFHQVGTAKWRDSTSKCAVWAWISLTWMWAAASGIDYDNTNSTNNASVNYSLREYANDVIYTIAEACRDAELPMPHIISESGRALTAHHALLLVKVIDVESLVEQPIPPLTDDDHSLLHEMFEDWRTITERGAKPRKVLEVFP